MVSKKILQSDSIHEICSNIYKIQLDMINNGLDPDKFLLGSKHKPISFIISVSGGSINDVGGGVSDHNHDGIMIILSAIIHKKTEEVYLTTTLHHLQSKQWIKFGNFIQPFFRDEDFDFIFKNMKEGNPRLYLNRTN